jgi:hypothetical protein
MTNDIINGLVICIFIFFAISLRAQNNTYFATDSSIAVGGKIIDHNEKQSANICKVLENNKVTVYSPYDLTEYGFNDGRVYVSRDIRINDSLRRVFLLRLVKDSTSLYYYRDEQQKKYFLEKNKGELINIPRRDPENTGITYRKKLSGLTSDCPYSGESAKLVNFHKISMERFVERYNSCKNRAFPYLKYGVYAGFGFSKLIARKEANTYLVEPDITPEFEADNGMVIGAFIDEPISCSDFSFHLECSVSDFDYSSNMIYQDTEIDILENTTAINIPVLFRYTFPTVKASPYVNLGGVYSYHIKHEHEAYATTFRDSTYIISLLEMNSPCATSQAGFSAGVGVSIRLNYRMRLYFDYRFSQLYGTGVKEAARYYERESLLNAGISF